MLGDAHDDWSRKSAIPFVMAIQTLRVFVVILTGPPMAKLISRYA